MRSITRRLGIVVTRVIGIGTLTALSLASAAAATSSEAGRHQVVGKITKADAQTGWLEMESLGGPMVLHFTPSVLAEFRRGDRVAVDLHFTRIGAQDAHARDQLVGDPSWRGHQTVETEVASIDAKTGQIHVKASEGQMTMHFLPGDVRTLKNGDRLTIGYSLKACPTTGQCLGGLGGRR